MKLFTVQAPGGPPYYGDNPGTDDDGRQLPGPSTWIVVGLFVIIAIIIYFNVKNKDT